MEMFDASDEVYEYLLMSICPVVLSKAGLSYNAQDNRIQDDPGLDCGYAGQRIPFPCL